MCISRRIILSQHPFSPSLKIGLALLALNTVVTAERMPKHTIASNYKTSFRKHSLPWSTRIFSYSVTKAPHVCNVPVPFPIQWQFHNPIVCSSKKYIINGSATHLNQCEMFERWLKSVFLRKPCGYQWGSLKRAESWILLFQLWPIVTWSLHSWFSFIPNNPLCSWCSQWVPLNVLCIKGKCSNLDIDMEIQAFFSLLLIFCCLNRKRHFVKLKAQKTVAPVCRTHWWMFLSH